MNCMAKHVYSLVVFLFAVAAANAQAPQGVNYQAVARNSAGVALASTNVTVRFTIHEGSASGLTLYQEHHSTTTNALGLFTAIIGTGVADISTLSSINWATGAKYL